MPISPSPIAGCHPRSTSGKIGNGDSQPVVNASDDIAAQLYIKPGYFNLILLLSLPQQRDPAMIIPLVICLASGLAVASVEPNIHSSMVVLSSRDAAPEGFVFKGVAPADSIIPLRIALTQADVGGLEQALYDISTSTSAKYGKHLSKAEVSASLLIVFLI